MSDSPHHTPIFRLNDDVFIHVLEINADMFAADESDALDTARFSSQVCRSWREIILNTPFLWGRIIDIDRLERLRSTDWATELMRRSGDSPLWIKGMSDWLRGCHPSHRQRLFFNEIIERNWSRILRLHLSGPILDDVDNSVGALYRPAPQLQVFHVRFSDNRRLNLTTNTSPRPMVLFSGRAPMLRHFSAEHHKADFSAPWLPNLDSITLGHAYDVSEYLKLVSATHTLQYLQVTGTTKEIPDLSHAVASLPVASLPRLKYLRLALGFDQMKCFVDHLEIPHGCLPDLYAHSHGLDAIKLCQILSTLSIVSQRYFKSHPPKKISITCDGSELVTVRENLRDDFRHQDCIFRVLHRPFAASPHDMSTISKSLSLPEFGGVTELKLRYRVFSHTAPDLSFLEFLYSVEILHVNEQMFRLLITACSHPSYSDGRHAVVFPKLRHITLQAGSFTYLEPCTVGDDTVGFILSRIETGHPISVLDLTACKESETDYPSVDRLKSISGLQIILRPRAGEGDL